MVWPAGKVSGRRDNCAASALAPIMRTGMAGGIAHHAAGDVGLRQAQLAQHVGHRQAGGGHARRVKVQPKFAHQAADPLDLLHALDAQQLWRDFLVDQAAELGLIQRVGAQHLALQRAAGDIDAAYHRFADALRQLGPRQGDRIAHVAAGDGGRQVLEDGDAGQALFQPAHHVDLELLG